MTINFNPDWVTPGFLPPYIDHTYTVRSAAWFVDTDRAPDQTERTVVVGHLISFVFPKQPGGAHGGLRLSSMSQPGQTNANRQRIYSTTNYEIIMCFADAFNLPNCFAVIFKRRRDFQQMFSSNALAEQATLGSTFLFIEPTPHDERLGDSLIVIQKPTVALLLKPATPFPTQEPIKAEEGGSQVAFYQTGKTIQVNRATLVVQQQSISCRNTTCDQQDINCSGCFGRIHTQGTKIGVIQADITVSNCHSYEPINGNAVFHGYRSTQWSTLYFDNLSELCNRSVDDIENLHNVIRTTTTALTNYINDNGGWTVLGWHRRGVHRVQNDEILAVNDTKGHLVLLRPSNPNCLSEDNFVNNKIHTPSINNVN